MRARSPTLAAFAALAVLAAPSLARADDATVSVGGRFAPPPDDRPAANAPVATDPDAYRERHRYDDDRDDQDWRDRRRSAFRLQLGPSTVTTGQGLGLGVGVGADFGRGSVGGRLSAGWLRGEGTNGDGTSSRSGDVFSHYGGEMTLDFLKRGPWHPILGMGGAILHVSRPDGNSGFAGAGTARIAIERALALEDADVRIGLSAMGGLVGPADDEIRNLRGFALVSAHLALGF